MGFAAQAPLYLPPWISAPSGHGVLTILGPRLSFLTLHGAPRVLPFHIDTMESPPIQATLSCLPQPDSTWPPNKGSVSSEGLLC